MAKKTLHPKGKEWRRKKMANPQPKTPEPPYRNDGLTNHERHVANRERRERERNDD